MHTKIRSAKFKAVDGAKSGTFSAVVAVYGNVDTVGDRIVEGAFDKSLKAWQALGDPIPIVLAHEWKDPFKHIGYAMPDKVKSVPGVGLVVEEGYLDVDDNPLAKQVHKLMERRTLKEFSFGYGIPQGGQTKASDGAMDLRMLDLIEFGPCLKGVNDKTELLSIKSQLTHEGVYVPSFEERLELVEAMLLDNTKAKMSAGRARWRSQKRHPETGRWIDQTAGPGFDGKPRKQASMFNAASIDSDRAKYNSDEKLSGSDKSKLNTLLNQAEDAFIGGDNAKGEALVREAAVVNREASDRRVYGDDMRSLEERGIVVNDENLRRDNEVKFPDGPPEDEFAPDEQEVASVTRQMDDVEAMLNSGDDPDNEDLDDAMGNLHVDMEQANFPPEIEKRHADLEKKWKAELDAWAGDGPTVSTRDLKVGDTVRRDGRIMDVTASDGGMITLEDENGEMYHYSNGTHHVMVEKLQSAGDQPRGGDEDNSADEDEIDNVTSTMDAVEGYLNDPYTSDIGGPDDLDDLMGDLHVEMEQANYPPELEKRYSALEQRWIDDDIGTAYSGPVGTPTKPSDWSTEDEKVLNTALDEIGLTLDDTEDYDQIEAFLYDLVSHSEMYPSDQVGAAERFLSSNNYDVPERMPYDPNFHTAEENAARGLAPSISESISGMDKKELNDLLEENIGLNLDDAREIDQIEGFLQDVISHAEMYTPEQVAAANRYFGEDSDAASEGTFEVNGEYKTAKELAPDRPWTKLESALGRFSVVGGKLEFQPYTESKKPKGSETQDQRDNRQALLSEATALMESRSNVKTNKVSRDTIHSLNAASYPGYEHLSGSEKADVKDLLDQAEYFLSDGMQEEAQSQYDLAFYMLKLARDSNGHWEEGKSRQPRPRGRLTLDAQISQLQTNAAIYASEAGLKKKGIVVTNRADALVDLLTQYEEELG